MLDLQKTKYKDWYIRSGKSEYTNNYTSWGSDGVLNGNSPLDENWSQTIRFEFGETREISIKNLIKDIEDNEYKKEK